MKNLIQILMFLNFFLITPYLLAQTKITWLPNETSTQFIDKNYPDQTSKLIHPIVKLPFGNHKETPVLLYGQENSFERGFIFIPNSNEPNVYTKHEIPNLWEEINMNEVVVGSQFLISIFSVNADCHSDQEVVILLHRNGVGAADEKGHRPLGEEYVSAVLGWENQKIKFLNKISDKLYGLKTEVNIKKQIKNLVKCSVQK